jgi:uncharacterized protein YhbP (UPF0306 family)
MDFNTIGQNIIKSNHFMSIATSYLDDTWIAPVYYFNDDSFTLYFVSSLDSKHVGQLLLNPQVAVSIFDSRQAEGDANGVQLRGIASKVADEKYYDVLSMFFQKNGKSVDPDTINDRITQYRNTGRAIFQIVPIDAFVQDPEHFKKYRIDKRVRIDL